MGEMEIKFPSGQTVVFTDTERDVSKDIRCDCCNAFKPPQGGYSLVVRGNEGTTDLDQLAVWICQSCHTANSR